MICKRLLILYPVLLEILFDADLNGKNVVATKELIIFSLNTYHKEWLYWIVQIDRPINMRFAFRFLSMLAFLSLYCAHMGYYIKQSILS
jgi:hypothetical protein